MKITVKTHDEAIAVAKTMLDGQLFMKDNERSERAGYPIYITEKENEWVSDLCVRLEVNQGAESMNIWIDPYKEIAEYQLADALEVIDNCIYKIDDNISTELTRATGIGQARTLLYGAYKEIRDILDAKYPESNLYAKYNLAEA